MGLLKGSVTIHRFKVHGPNVGPSELGTLLDRDAFRVPGDPLWEVAHGFAGPFGPFSLISEAEVVNGFDVFGFRVDTRRVPASVLNAHVDQRVKSLMSEKGFVRISRDARLSIKDEVKAELIKKVLPSPRLFEVAWNVGAGELTLFNAPGRVVDVFKAVMMKAFGVQLEPIGAIGKPDEDPEAFQLNQDFMAWLWRRGIESGGTSGSEGDHSAVFVDDRMTFASETGDVKTVGLAQGNPAESQEAFELLSKEMTLASAKLRLLSGDLEWVWTMTAGAPCYRAVKMPPSAAKGQVDVLHERLFLVQEFLAHLERRVAEFSKNPSAVRKLLQMWAMQQQIDGDLMGGSELKQPEV